MSAKNPSSGSSYGQILKSSSIVGSAQVLVFAISLIKTKVAAVLLGPSGVGLVGLYQVLVGLFTSVAGLGLNTSGIREIAAANSSGESDELSRAAKTLLRLSLLTGVSGCLLMIALSWPMSQWTFESGEQALGIAVLGSVIIFGAVSAAQAAILQGLRRVSDLARINLGCAAVGSLVSVGFYAWLRERGIIPALISSAILGLGIHWWYLRRVALGKVSLTWSETVARSGPMLRLGLAMAWSGLLLSGVAMLTRALIVRELGLDANGYYQAASTISGLFSGILLGAMAADFFPRLTAASHDDNKTNELVNQQTEIGILLATPAIVATILFAPSIVELLFSSKFSAAIPLVPWLMCGIFAQLLLWPMGTIFVARGSSKLFATVETAMSSFQAVSVVTGLYFFGLVGVAAAFVLKMSAHTLICLVVFKKMIGFEWTGSTIRVIRACLVAVGISLVVASTLEGLALLTAAVVFTAITFLFCLHSVAQRVQAGSKIAEMVKKALAWLPLLLRRRP